MGVCGYTSIGTRPPPRGDAVEEEETGRGRGIWVFFFSLLSIAYKN